MNSKEAAALLRWAKESDITIEEAHEAAEEVNEKVDWDIDAIIDE